jgi:hypothetical protein
MLTLWAHPWSKRSTCLPLLASSLYLIAMGYWISDLAKHPLYSLLSTAYPYLSCQQPDPWNPSPLASDPISRLPAWLNLGRLLTER